MPKPTQASRLTSSTRPQLMLQTFSGSESSRGRPRSRCETLMGTSSLAARRESVGCDAPVGHAARGIALLQLDQDVSTDRRRHCGAAARALAAVLHDNSANVAR